MPISYAELKAMLDVDEPDYPALSETAAGAIRHLRKLAASADASLASKAVSLAGIMGDADCVAIVGSAVEVARRAGARRRGARRQPVAGRPRGHAHGEQVAGRPRRRRGQARGTRGHAAVRSRRDGEGQAGQHAHGRSRACGDGEEATAGKEHDHGHESGQDSGQDGGWRHPSSRRDPPAQERGRRRGRCPPAP